MKILITGAAGYIGNKLAHTLADSGHDVHALVRSDAAKGLLQHPNISIFLGDILNKDDLMHAMNGCRQVYHTAALVAPWVKNTNDFYTVNVNGTANVLEVAAQTGITKTVFTSTCGVIGPSLNEPMREEDPRVTGFAIDYELSKKMAEDIVLQYSKQGMNVVTVAPSKVYGPGNVSHALTSNAVIDKFIQKKVVFIPSPGNQKACFAFIDDVVNGHVLAMEKGKAGEKYILGGINISYRQFFQQVREVSCCGGKIISLSEKSLQAWAVLQWAKYKLTGVPPAFTPKAIKIVLSNYTFSSDKAVRELGYTITPLQEALHNTIHFLKTPNHA